MSLQALDNNAYVNGLLAELAEANKQTPILMCHGTYDSVLPIRLGETSRDYLRGLGYKVEWHAYPVDHQVSEEEIAEIAKWLRARLETPSSESPASTHST